jgi:hypothetical protein
MAMSRKRRRSKQDKAVSLVISDTLACFLSHPLREAAAVVSANPAG